MSNTMKSSKPLQPTKEKSGRRQRRKNKKRKKVEDRPADGDEV